MKLHTKILKRLRNIKLKTEEPSMDKVRGSVMLGRHSYWHAVCAECVNQISIEDILGVRFPRFFRE